jgi:hypothetical protein
MMRMAPGRQRGAGWPGVSAARVAGVRRGPKRDTAGLPLTLPMFLAAVEQREAAKRIAEAARTEIDRLVFAKGVHFC